jgi:hypothetical protein
MRICIRKAKHIPRSERDLFDRYGEQVIGFVLAGGFTPAAKELNPVYNDDTVKAYARDWLTERSDIRERHETLMFWLEVGVLLFVILGVVIDLCILHRGL